MSEEAKKAAVKKFYPKYPTLTVETQYPPSIVLGFVEGWDAHAEHTAATIERLCNEHHEHQQCDLCDQQDMTLAAIREKAEALVLRMSGGGMNPGVFSRAFYAETLTALKAELEKRNG